MKHWPNLMGTQEAYLTSMLKEKQFLIINGLSKEATRLSIFIYMQCNYLFYDFGADNLKIFPSIYSAACSRQQEQVSFLFPFTSVELNFQVKHLLGKKPIRLCKSQAKFKFQTVLLMPVVCNYQIKILTVYRLII